MIRPGPDAIEPGEAPGGVVLRCYSVPDQLLIFERHLVADDNLEGLAVDDADFAGAITDTVCLVAYDGDSGERMPLREWYQ